MNLKKYWETQMMPKHYTPHYMWNVLLKRKLKINQNIPKGEEEVLVVACFDEEEGSSLFVINYLIVNEM